MPSHHPAHVCILKNGTHERLPYGDPRLLLIKYMDWQDPGPYAIYSPCKPPAPSNYNRALWGTKWFECPFVNDQVFYIDPDGYRVTLYYLPRPINEEKWNEWVAPLDWIRRWDTKGVIIKPAPPLLRKEKKPITLDLEEMLYIHNHYDYLKKYLPEEKIKSIIGEPRPDIYDVYEQLKDK